MVETMAGIIYFRDSVYGHEAHVNFEAIVDIVNGLEYVGKKAVAVALTNVVVKAVPAVTVSPLNIVHANFAAFRRIKEGTGKHMIYYGPHALYDVVDDEKYDAVVEIELSKIGNREIALTVGDVRGLKDDNGRDFNAIIITYKSIDMHMGIIVPYNIRGADVLQLLSTDYRRYFVYDDPANNVFAHYVRHLIETLR